MTDRTHNIMVGLTAIVGTAGLAVMLLMFGYVPSWLEGGYHIRVTLANASGLSEGSRVKLSGIDIGQVKRVDLLNPPQQGVVVTTLIRQDVKVPGAAYVSVESPLLGGSPTLTFDISRLGPTQMDQFLPTDGSAEIQGQALTLVSQFAGELKTAINEPSQQFTRLVDQLERLVNEWVAVGKNINKLIETRTPELVDSGKTLGNLSTIFVRTDQRLAEIQGVIAGVDKWLNDSQLHEDVAGTAANAKQLTERLQEATGSAQEFMSQTNVNIGRLVDRYVAVADDVAGAVASLRQAIDQAGKDKGTLGKLLNDPALYENLNDSTQRLQKALDEFRLLIQKWKAEGLPIQF